MIFDRLRDRMRAARIEPTTGGKIEQVCFEMLAIHIAVSYISNALSKCEIKIYEDGAATKNELYYALNVAPNPNQNAPQLINQAIWRMFVPEPGGRYGSLLVIDKGRIYSASGYQVIENALTGNSYTEVTVGEKTLHKKFRASDVLLLKLEDKNIKSLIDGVFSRYEEALTTAFATYKASNGTKFTYEIDSYPGGQEAFERDYKEKIAAGMQAFMNAPAAVLPLFRGQKLQKIQASPSSPEEILKLRKEIFSMTAQAFKIPESMMYGNVTNTKDVINQFLTFGVDPYASMIGRELTRKCFTYEQWKKGSYVEVDTTHISHIDIFEAAEKAEKLIGSALLCVNECRSQVGLPPINEAWAWQHWMTKNNDTAEHQMRAAEEMEV